MLAVSSSFTASPSSSGKSSAALAGRKSMGRHHCPAQDRRPGGAHGGAAVGAPPASHSYVELCAPPQEGRARAPRPLVVSYRAATVRDCMSIAALWVSIREVCGRRSDCGCSVSSFSSLSDGNASTATLETNDDIEPGQSIRGVVIQICAWSCMEHNGENVLASASADKTVKLWDLNTGQCAVTLQHHDGEVQSVAWRSPEVLLGGSFDKLVIMNDMRDNGQTHHKWSVEAEVESLACDPHNENSFLVSLDNGMIQAFDTRTASWGTDKIVKLWDISNNQPSCRGDG